MRINYNNYPVLRSLLSGEFRVRTIPNETTALFDLDGFSQMMEQNFKEQHRNFKKEIFSITKPFVVALNNNCEKLKDIAKDEFLKDSFNGTFIVDDCVYFLSKEKDDIVFFITTRTGHLLGCYVGIFELCSSKWKSGFIPLEVEQYILQIYFISIFLKYAQIETKILKPKKKEKIFGCKYLNETNNDITVLDSTWFTNLVKSEGFNVRGHFRLQPKKKDGEWTKELIWINEFEKSGYNRKAKLLTHQ